MFTWKWVIVGFIRQELLQKAKDRYHNRGGIEKATKYYVDNEEVLKEKANNKYRNSSQKEKGVKRKYGKIETKKWKKKQAKKMSNK